MSDTLFAPRFARKMTEAENAFSDPPLLPLESLRDLSAWVLLGEPGAGKSSAFTAEADAAGGVCISIARFLSDEPDESWRGKTLFLDGLDETRASGSTDTLLSIRAHLRKLGKPKFRIACRAADWFGETDKQDISDISPDGKLDVFTLQPLDEQDVEDILVQNHDIEDAKVFVKRARDLGLHGLLENPQTLALLADAVRDGAWPDTRQQTFEMACHNLAREHSKRHRDLQRANAVADERLLDAAGQIFAALLLSNSSGIALDRDSANVRFPLLEDIKSPDPEAAKLVTGRKLFRQSTEGEERLEPVHRSIAEYLAARWLARQLDHKGLPLQRVFNLLLGHDGRTVAGLRGLYGWLALCSQEARGRLIKADPVTVIVYGDAKPLSTADKRDLLSALDSEAQQNPNFMNDVWQSPAWGAMADPELTPEFKSVLESSNREALSQALTDCVLEILVKGLAIPALKTTFNILVKDESRWEGIRVGALDAWMIIASSLECVELLDALFIGQPTDVNDRLVNKLLMHLYPGHLKPDELFKYLRETIKSGLRFSQVSSFWRYQLPRETPDSDLPVLLDQLASLPSTISAQEPMHGSGFADMANSLLARGISIHGDNIDDQRLYSWLGVGLKDQGHFTSGERNKDISDWLACRPNRYKAVLLICYANCPDIDDYRLCLPNNTRRLRNASMPADLGHWHLEQASKQRSDKLAQHHLFEAVLSLRYKQGNQGLSKEVIEQWGKENPQREHWIAPMLHPAKPEWEMEHEKDAAQYKVKQAKRKRDVWADLSTRLEEIRSGAASVGLMHQLAGIWLDQYTDVHGETVLERFESYSEHGAELLVTASDGFQQCVLRDDIPSATEIVDLCVKSREHLIRKPCLVGMDLRWQQNKEFIEEFAEERLRSMVAFRLTYGVDADPEWFTHCVSNYPVLVADVLVEYALAVLKSGQSRISGFYELANDKRYLQVAEKSVVKILRGFPVRAPSQLLNHLKYLLNAAIRYSIKFEEDMLDRKINSKSMDIAQRVYWIAAATVMSPAKYEPLFLKFVGGSWKRANYLCDFLTSRLGNTEVEATFSVRIMSRMIELLAPHADIDRGKGGWVNEAMIRGEFVLALITRMGSCVEEPEVEAELERLLAQPLLNKLRFHLNRTKNELRQKKREASFRFSSLSNVVQILANKAPTNAQDLLALTVAHLDKIAIGVRNDNDIGIASFWNVENRAPVSKRREELCSKVLITYLRHRLAPFEIDCQVEHQCANEKRADIYLSFRNALELPFEVKRDDNDQLWSAIRKQLIDQYSISPKAEGCGIYLVLWFGAGDHAPARDGGKKPASPGELQQRLEATLTEEERSRIVVRVLDVSWPA